MKKSGILQMRTDGEFERLLDGWRRQQPTIPSRAEAIRQLVRIGIECSGQMVRHVSGGEGLATHTPAAGA